MAGDLRDMPIQVALHQSSKLTEIFKGIINDAMEVALSDVGCFQIGR